MALTHPRHLIPRNPNPDNDNLSSGEVVLVDEENSIHGIGLGNLRQRDISASGRRHSVDAREPLLKGKDQYGRPHFANLFRALAFDNENIIYFFLQN